MHRLIPILLLALGAAVPVDTFAQSADEASADETSADEEGQDARSETEVEATEKKPSSEVFIPTEEISEDFAVSFPVDI